MNDMLALLKSYPSDTFSPEWLVDQTRELTAKASTCLKYKYNVIYSDHATSSMGSEFNYSRKHILLADSQKSG